MKRFRIDFTKANGGEMSGCHRYLYRMLEELDDGSLTWKNSRISLRYYKGNLIHHVIMERDILEWLMKVEVVSERLMDFLDTHEIMVQSGWFSDHLDYTLKNYQWENV